MPDRIRFVTFRRTGVFYGLDIAEVRQAVRLSSVESLAAVPDFVAGRSFVDRRYEIIVDLARVFSPGEATAGSHAVLVSREGREFGFLADRLGDVVEVGLDGFRPLPPFVGAGRPDWLRGLVTVERREILILDLRRILEAAAPDRISAD